MPISVTINGEIQTLSGTLSVQGLLEHIGIKEGKVAVEHNLEIVPRSLYRETLVNDGDRMEIVHFIGGG
jgi:thiamine biosynthesis protein ThiS